MIDVIPFLLIGAVFWFLLIKPQMDEKRVQEELVQSLAKDDMIVTASGIHGQIAQVMADTILLDIGGKTRITLEKTSVVRRIDGPTSK